MRFDPQSFVPWIRAAAPVHPRAARQDDRHRLRWRGRRRRDLPRHRARPQPVAQPRHAPGRGARRAPADRGDTEAAEHRQSLPQGAARHRRGDDGLRARGDGSRAQPHRGAAVARARQFADGRRAHPRRRRQLHHRQADRHRRRHRHGIHRRGSPRRHRRRCASVSTTATWCWFPRSATRRPARYSIWRSRRSPRRSPCGCPRTSSSS